jgi:hypothetical protein
MAEMLVAVASGFVEDAGELVELTAGRTRIHPEQIVALRETEEGLVAGYTIEREGGSIGKHLSRSASTTFIATRRCASKSRRSGPSFPSAPIRWCFDWTNYSETRG